MRKNHALRLSALLIGAAFASQAYASGYHFGTQSVSAQGTANASGASAEDASTVFYNPAGLSYLKGTTVSGVLNVVLPSGKYTDRGSHTTALPFAQNGYSTGGGDGGDFVKPTAVPHAYMSHQVSDKLAFGFGLFVPFGSKTKYDDNWAGRYNVIETELKTIALNPSFSLNVSEGFKIGGGVTAQHIEGKLKKAADFGSGAVGLLGSQLPPQTLAALAALVAGNPNFSGDVKVKGDDWAFGWNLGMMFQIDPNFRVGLAYRSKIRHELGGTADWTVPQSFASLAPLGAAGAIVQSQLNALYSDSGATLKVDTPESLSLSFHHQFTDRFALMGDITRTGHARFQELRIDFHNTLADSNTPENWGDTTKVSLGGTYKMSDQLLLRGGFAYDNSPVNDANRTPSIPDADRKWFSIGANWALNKNSSLDLAYSYVHVGKPSVNNYDNGGLANNACDRLRNTSSCATIIGEYDVKSSILGVQYNYRF